MPGGMLPEKSEVACGHFLPGLKRGNLVTLRPLPPGAILFE